MKFSIDIELGNAAMSTTDDVARALECTAKKIRDYADPVLPGECGRVMDINGNMVGEWRFTSSTSPSVGPSIGQCRRGCGQCAKEALIKRST